MRDYKKHPSPSAPQDKYRVGQPVACFRQCTLARARGQRLRSPPHFRRGRKVSAAFAALRPSLGARRGQGCPEGRTLFTSGAARLARSTTTSFHLHSVAWKGVRWSLRVVCKGNGKNTCLVLLPSRKGVKGCESAQRFTGTVISIFKYSVRIFRR